jgi:Uma2 family endonuclease
MGAELIPKLSYEQFRQLPDDGKYYELIHGEVHLSPARSTKHQMLLGNLVGGLGTYVRTVGLGVSFSAPLDVCLNPDTALQPDLIFISELRAGIIEENWIAGARDLVVEVLSPSTAA